MTPIEKLKELEAKATPGPWIYSHVSDSIFPPSGDGPMVLDSIGFEDGRFVELLRNLAPSLIALWEAVEASKGPLCSCPTIIKALNELNAKAKEILK